MIPKKLHKMDNKMTIKFSVLSLLASIFCLESSSVYAQNEGCLEEIKTIYTAMQSKMDQLNNNVFYMNITQTNKLSESLGGEIHESNMELTYNGKLSHLKSNEIEVLQDAQNTISIIPNRQLVMINKSSLDEFKQSILLQTSAMYEEIFANATVISCTRFKKNGAAFKRVILELNSEKQEQLRAKQFIYTIAEKPASIQEVQVFYTANAGQLEYMIVKFNELSYNKATAHLSSSPKAELYDTSGRLKSRFSSYKIVDNTK